MGRMWGISVVGLAIMVAMIWFMPDRSAPSAEMVPIGVAAPVYPTSKIATPVRAPVQTAVVKIQKPMKKIKHRQPAAIASRKANKAATKIAVPFQSQKLSAEDLAESQPKEKEKIDKKWVPHLSGKSSTAEIVKKTRRDVDTPCLSADDPCAKGDGVSIVGVVFEPEHVKESPSGELLRGDVKRGNGKALPAVYLK